MIIFDSQAAIAFSTMYKMFQKGFQFVRRTRSGEKCAAGAKKLKQAKITVSDVKNMENIATFTKNVYKNRAEGAIFFGDLVKSVKSPPLLFGISATRGGFLLTIPLMCLGS